MKSIQRICALAVFAALAGFAFRAEALSFDPPDVTFYDVPNKTPVLEPGRFDVYQFVGADVNDVVVPTMMPPGGPATVYIPPSGTLQGLDNKNNWPDPGPNTYFTHNYDGNVDRTPHPHQAISASIDANPLRDIIVLNWEFFIVCYNYNGKCESWSNPIPISAVVPGADDAKIIPWVADVADFTGDGKDDVAIAGISASPIRGWVTVYKNMLTGGADPFDVHYGPKEVPGGIPVSLVAADTDGDGNADITTGQMPHFKNCDSNGAFLRNYKNTGGAFAENPVTRTYKSNECYFPSDLIAIDPDGDNKSDLVMTCYFKVIPKPAEAADADFEFIPEAEAQERVCPVTWAPSDVYILKGDGSGTVFNPNQTLTGFNYPFASTASDYDKDGDLDLAVTEHQGRNIVLYTGTGPFQVDASADRRSTSSFFPLHIQSWDMNGDTWTDIVVVANDLKFPWLRRTPPIATDSVPLNHLDSSSVLVSRTAFTNNQVLLANQGDYANLYRDTNYLNIAEETLTASVDGYKLAYTANRVDSQFRPALLYNQVDTIEVAPYQLRAVVTAAAPTDGVLVLVNNHSEVTIDRPDCDKREGTFRCLASAGHKITACDATADAGVTITAATPVSGTDDREWKGSYKLPAENKIYTIKVTATDDTPKTTTGEVSADLSKCATAACPAKTLTLETWAWYPFNLCVEDSFAASAGGKAIEWSVNSGSAAINFGEGPDGSLITSGECIQGTLGPKDKPNYIEKVVVDGTYKLQGTNVSCPFQVIGNPIELRGNRFCSLGPVAPLSFGGALGLFGALLGAVFGLGAWRLKKK